MRLDLLQPGLLLEDGFWPVFSHLLWPSAQGWGDGVIPAGGISIQREMSHERIRERKREKHTTQGGQLCFLGVVCEMLQAVQELHGLPRGMPGHP